MTQIGLIGLGAMGSNLAQGLAARGIDVVGFSYDAAEMTGLTATPVALAADPADLVARLTPPRQLFLFVTAGEAVDHVIADVEEQLTAGDVIVDCGNSHFRDTERRQGRLAARGLSLLGAGVSGGAEGARTGASVMVGGARQAFDNLVPVFEAMAARYRDTACMTRTGEGGSGHFVKMVHNGIEYGLMQAIAEVWQLMEHQQMSRERQAEVFDQWNRGHYAAFLTEITARILRFQDPLQDGLLLDQIVDSASQKGTGRWTVEAALELGVPVPTIAAAVNERMVSSMTRIPVEGQSAGRERRTLAAGDLEQALGGVMTMAFAQGFDLLAEASRRYDWELDLAAIASIWRDGCIVRATMLDDMAIALAAANRLTASPWYQENITRCLAPMRRCAGGAIEAGLSSPALCASLNWHDALTSRRLPTNLIQAQRDYFGAHSYRRRDREGTFTTDWQNE